MEERGFMRLDDEKPMRLRSFGSQAEYTEKVYKELLESLISPEFQAQIDELRKKGSDSNGTDNN